MEYYQAVRFTNYDEHIQTWNVLKGFMVNEVSDFQNVTYYIIPLV